MELNPEQRAHAFRPFDNMEGLLKETPEGAFVANNAVVCGDVSLAKDVNVWFSTVIRADDEPISIGEGTNIQDGCVLHVDIDFPLVVGSFTSIGHKAMLHGCTIGDGVLVGMGAILLNGCVIGDGSLIGAGALIPEGMVVPPRSLVLGLPGKVRGEVSEAQVRRIRFGVNHYIERVQTYLG